MKNILRLEELAMFGLSIYALYYMQVPWWCYPILILGPDISMLGYVVGNSVGAFTYNLFHHKGIAIALFMIGWLMPMESLQIVGIILFGHASMDRVFGYGLKMRAGFRFTHLGTIGKN